MRTHTAHLARAVAILVSCLLAAELAQAKGPDLPEVARRSTLLAMDFCGTFMGERPEVTIPGTAKLVAGLAVSEPLPVEQIDPDAGVRSGMMSTLQLGADDRVRIASFSTPPSVREAPFAVIKASDDFCYIYVPSGDAAVLAALDSRLRAGDSVWHLDESKEAAFWHRSAPFNERVLLNYMAHEDFTAVIVALMSREASSFEDLETQVRGAITGCVEGVISGKPADAAAFKGTFDFYQNAPSAKNPTVQWLDLHATIGPRAWLQVRSKETESACDLLTSDQKQPFDKVMEVVTRVITQWPGAKSVDVKARGDEPAHTAWRVSRKGTKRTADISVAVERNDVAMVRVR